jgi:hypothetical protein
MNFNKDRNPDVHIGNKPKRPSTRTNNTSLSHTDFETKINALKAINKTISWLYFLVNPYMQNYSNVQVPLPLSNKQIKSILETMRSNSNLTPLVTKDDMSNYHLLQLGKLVKTHQKFRNAILYILDLNQQDLTAETKVDFNNECESFIKNIFNIISYFIKCFTFAPLQAPAAVNYMLSAIFFVSARNKFLSTFHKDDICRKKIMLLLTLILEATFYCLNVNLRKSIGTIIPSMALEQIFGNKYKDITFAISSSSKELRTFLSNHILSPSTIKYYDQMLSWIQLQYELVYFPYIIKSTSPTKNLLHKNLKTINQSMTKLLNTVADLSRNQITNTRQNKKITFRLVTSLLVLVGDLLFPDSDYDTFLGSHETFAYDLNNTLTTQTSPNNQLHNLSKPSELARTLWRQLLQCVDYLNPG